MSDSYLLYQKYQKIGQTGNWIPVYPMEYSYNADGTMMPVVKTQNDPACGLHDYSQDYLTIESLEDNNVIRFNSVSSITISASTDNGRTWTGITSPTPSGGESTTTTTITTLNTGGKVLLKGLNDSYRVGEIAIIKTDKRFDVYGNIMSLVSGDSFANATTIVSIRAFYRLFYFSKVVDASNLILPATTLSEGCYANMFGACTSLTTAPELPATTLADTCYYRMFRDCTSLTVAPELPAETLANGCYSNMFSYCTSLTVAPELPATTLVQSCYYSMFRGCTSLVTTPELPATTLAVNCYKEMFYGCTSLNNVKCLATDISATDCTSNWLYNVASSGTFVKNSSMTGWTTGINGIPDNWTITNA